MQCIAILSDTHVPSRADRIPDRVREEIRAADRTIHAGDFDSEGAFETVRDLADGRLTAVEGNMDPFGLDLPGVATVDVEDVRFVVTHGTGPASGYRDRVAATVAEHAGETATVGVSGHTHDPLDATVDGVRLLNPGSATGAAPAAAATMYTAEVDGDRVDVTRHES